MKKKIEENPVSTPFPVEAIPAKTQVIIENDPSALETEAYLNEEILSMTLKIRAKYPQLSKFIDEMPVTIPNEKDPEVTRKALKNYLESLKNLLNKYVLENPDGLN